MKNTFDLLWIEKTMDIQDLPIIMKEPIIGPKLENDSKKVSEWNNHLVNLPSMENLSLVSEGISVITGKFMVICQASLEHDKFWSAYNL